MLAALLLMSAGTAVPLPAFPGAEGAGALALGGRGGKVLTVTTLADSGPGSLRAAVEAKGPRIIVFAVSGTIQLQKPLTVREGQVTIAGQSAPGDGITLRDHPLVVQADDVVIRFIRSRLGDESKTESDAIWIRAGRRIILDHVSASWSVDETLSVSGNYAEPGEGWFDVTVQWSIIADSLTRSLHAKGAHGYGSLVRGGRGARASFHHNLWANHSARMPRPGNYAPAASDPEGAYFDFRCNLFYNWGGSRSGYNADKDSLSRYNFVGNAYVRGPQSTKAIAFQEGNPVAKSFFADNMMDGVIPSDPWSLVSGIVDPAQKLSAPVEMAKVGCAGSAGVEAKVLASAGASRSRDSVDAAVVEGVRTRTGQQIDRQSDVGGWPALRSGPAPVDSDGDGMPDAWETKQGLDPKRDDSAGDRDGNGYTNIEDYLNALAVR
ncbi:polysaccharide lyase family 1 protein [Sphingomonas sp. J315]|uniref:pectate lyase family protein n=1 Tax=Sphingomonas sp. J315 TaxID=2898433 RepID=UPI0021AE1A6A|nr:pectate lyase [Sphingomonas sp. J315]UUY00631.1 pectate lyase [Sphingomonas sp. J315]